MFCHPKIDTFFLPFLKNFKSEFLVQDVISRLIVDVNGISIYQNIGLSTDNQKQIKF